MTGTEKQLKSNKNSGSLKTDEHLKLVNSPKLTRQPRSDEQG